MKKIITTAITLLFIGHEAIHAQNIQPCNTYHMQEYYAKTIPGYAEKLQAITQQTEADFLSHLNGLSTQKTSSLSPSYTFTIPVVFHILHTNGPENISDAACAAALAQVNSDYARLGSDTNTIDPLFKPLYLNSKMHFQLAQKDPNGNCTSGVIHHYDPNTIWDQDNALYHYKYTGSWIPSKYLNIYIVKGITGSGIAPGTTVVGYTHLPGTAPSTGSDAIVYTYSFLGGLDARSLSHEIGHWFGLSHTFGGSNNAGVNCDNDDIYDTPRTTGFFSTCPKVNNLTFTPSVLNLNDSSEIVNVTLGSIISNTSKNSLQTILAVPSGTGVAVTKTLTAKGFAGGYTDLSKSYPLEVAYNNASAVTLPLSIKSLAAYTDSNSVGVYFDKNNNGLFSDAGEAVFVPTVAVIGTNTFSSSITIPGGLNGYYRMRVITNKGVVTDPLMSITSGEVEDYLLAVRLSSCDSIRPNIENFMDYSSCPKMFTQGQTAKIRYTAYSTISDRHNLSDTANLVAVGFWHPTTIAVISPSTATSGTVIGHPADTTYNYAVNPVVPCAPIADFYANKTISCNGQSVTFNSTSYNSAPTSYAWVFEGGTPATSTSANPTITYNTPGTYSVSLTVSNAYGTNTKSVISFINNSWNSNDPNYPYTQDFEGGLNNGWSSKNLDYLSVEWQSCNVGSQNTSKSMVLPNFDGGYHEKNIDILESPLFNFHNVSNISISIDYCAPRKVGVAGSLKSLFFQYSTDCGGTWVNMPVNFPSDSVMATFSGVTSTGPYIPWDASKWKTLTNSPAVLATPIANKRDVKFRFWYQNTYAVSQHLYLDQFNISGTVGIEDFANNIGLSLYPNPASESTTLEFTSPVDSKATVTVNDVLGRQVEASALNVNAGLVTKHNINASKQLSAGIYFVTLNLGNQKVTKKLIIE
jgi:PKD repeat protein